MEGIASNKIQRLVKLVNENKYILLIVFFPLFLHYFLKLLCLGYLFDLNNFLIARDIYLIILSIYLGYLFLEIIRILRLPALKWKLIQDGTQVLLEIDLHRDFLNEQLGISTLDKVSNRITLNNGSPYRGKWQSMPEPLIPVVLNEALYDGNIQSITYIPNTALIPGNKYSYIKYGEQENLILFWRKEGKLYKIDEYRYHIALRFDDDLTVELPQKIEIELDNNSEKYIIQINLDENLLTNNDEH